MNGFYCSCCLCISTYYLFLFFPSYLLFCFVIFFTLHSIINVAPIRALEIFFLMFSRIINIVFKLKLKPRYLMLLTCSTFWLHKLIFSFVFLYLERLLVNNITFVFQTLTPSLFTTNHLLNVPRSDCNFCLTASDVFPVHNKVVSST